MTQNEELRARMVAATELTDAIATLTAIRDAMEDKP